MLKRQQDKEAKETHRQEREAATMPSTEPLELTTLSSTMTTTTTPRTPPLLHPIRTKLVVQRWKRTHSSDFRVTPNHLRHSIDVAAMGGATVHSARGAQASNPLRDQHWSRINH